MTDSLGFLTRKNDGPSELTLDRYAAGELDAEARAEVERWLAGHPERARQIDERGTFPSPMAGPRAEQLFGRIAAAVEARPVPRWKAWLRALVTPGGLGGLVIVAALALLVARPWDTGEVLRVKGTFGFLVHRKTAAGSEVFVSGDEARSGDVLRFEIDLPEPRHVLVFSQEQRGAFGVAWPLDGGDASRLVDAGPRALKGAVELDDALGDEWLHAVSCPRPVEASAFGVAGPGRLLVPDGCKTTAVHLRKVAP